MCVFSLYKQMYLVWVTSSEQQEVEYVQHRLNWDFELCHKRVLLALTTLIYMMKRMQIPYQRRHTDDKYADEKVMLNIVCH